MATGSPSQAELIRELVQQVVWISEETGQLPLAILKDLRRGNYAPVFVDGTSKISVGANGHTISVSPFLTPDQLIILFQKAYDVVANSTDPTDPDIPSASTRLRANFSLAQN